MENEIRYYMGRHKIRIVLMGKKKALIRHLEKGHVGNKKIGYKDVKLNGYDTVLIRHCYKKQIDYPNFGQRFNELLEGLN